jgi:hypothetical protein
VRYHRLVPYGSRAAALPALPTLVSLLHPVLPSHLLTAARARRESNEREAARAATMLAPVPTVELSLATWAPVATGKGAAAATAASSSPSIVLGGCARLLPFSRTDREDTARHHASSLLSAERGSALDGMAPDIVDIHRIAMGDLPIPELRILAEEEAEARMEAGADGAGGGGGSSGAASAAASASAAAAASANGGGGGAGSAAMVFSLGGGSSSSFSSGARISAAEAHTLLSTAEIASARLALLGGMSGGADGTLGPEVVAAVSTTHESHVPLSDMIAAQSYRAMRAFGAASGRLRVLRSVIHGWGLHTALDVPAHTVVVEYTGECAREPVCDRREIVYENQADARFAHMKQRGGAGAGAGAGAQPAMHPEVVDAAAAGLPPALPPPSSSGGGSVAGFDLATFYHVPLGDNRRSDGSGSCYLFRLDDEFIVDATHRGSAARFINHSCEPNCYSRVLAVDGAKRIVICALRDLRAGEELTYNYKFAIENDAQYKLQCYCGAPSCWGTMN